MGDGLPDFVMQTRHLFILGADRSGKSALAKTLYRRQAHQLVPLLISGDDLQKGCALDGVFDAAFKRQYNGKAVLAFNQLAPSKVCVIVDDLSRATLSRKQLSALIEYAERIADKVIIFANDIFDVDCVIAGRQLPLFFDYKQYVIEELNRYQRARLIAAWVHLSYSDSEPEASYDKEIENKERIINTLLGRQLVPALPVIVLAFLQTMDSTRRANTTNGSYGELYESLITDRLAKVSRKPTDVGIKYAILSRLAYGIYVNEATGVTKDEVQRACDDYHQEIGLRLSADTLIGELLRAGIFRSGDGCFSFFYPYYYHFFVARYFRDKIKDESLTVTLTKQLMYMADRVYYEQYVNIIVFYLYLSKDTAIIEHILANAKKIYSAYRPCNLTTDLDNLNNLSTSPPEPLTIAPVTDQNWHDARRTLDAAEEAQQPQQSEKLEYDESLNDLIKVTIAFKTIHILGQVLRNFPGTSGET